MKCGLLCSVQSECHLLIYNYMHVNFCKQLLSYGGDYIDSVGTYLSCYNGVTMDYFSTRRQLYKVKFTIMWWPVFFFMYILLHILKHSNDNYLYFILNYFFLLLKPPTKLRLFFRIDNYNLICIINFNSKHATI